MCNNNLSTVPFSATCQLITACKILSLSYAPSVSQHEKCCCDKEQKVLYSILHKEGNTFYAIFCPKMGNEGCGFDISTKALRSRR